MNNRQEEEAAAAYEAMKSAAAVQFPEQEQLKCPRCESSNTKFCYYNNYNLSQPRHFCKNCRRYWTKGGALRNIPVGGGSRKSSSSSAAAPSSSSSNKRSSSSSAAPAAANPKRSAVPAVQDPAPDPRPDQGRVIPAVVPGSFSSLLASNGQFGGGGVFDSGSGGDNPGRVGDGFLGLQGGDWVGGGSGWPDLAMYTPGSSFQLRE